MLFRINALRLTLTWVICMIGFSAISQCKITPPANSTICLGDLGYFSVSSSSTIQTADWTFGDGYTATGTNPGHLYVKSGTFTVLCKLKLAGGGTCEDSVKVKVVNLPKASFQFVTLDTCFGNNSICIKDKSKAADATQHITNRIVIWDDGSFTKIDTTKGFCHKYKQKTKYKITLEVTDNKSCKSIYNQTINIVPSVDAKFRDSIYKKCGESTICFINTTDTGSKDKNKYIWQFDQGSYINSTYSKKHCFTKFSSGKMSAMLLVDNQGGCRDSFVYNFLLEVDSLPKVKFILSDTSVCYNTAKPLIIKLSPTGDYSADWSLNGKNVDLVIGENVLFPKIEKILPNSYKLKCKIKMGDCSLEIDTHFTVRGPRADITIFNNGQCDASKKVFFIDSTKVTNYKRSSRLWVLSDKYGDSCISKRAQDINKYKNCNYSTDWYHKHVYTKDTAINRVWFYVYDSITRCGDEINGTSIVNTDACGFKKKDTICQSGYYRGLVDGTKLPTDFSLDSGKTWMAFPSDVNKKYVGLYSVMLRYYEAKTTKITDFGDDSIRSSKDTLKYSYRYLKDQLLINPLPDPKFKYTITGGCNTKDVVVKLNSPKLLAKEMIVFVWGDGSKNDTIMPKGDMVFDSIKHHYSMGKLGGTISVQRTSPENCLLTHDLAINFGYEIYWNYRATPCINNDVCFDVEVFDNEKGTYWNSTNKLGSLKIHTGESMVFINNSKPCYKYGSIGIKNIRIVCESKNGCKDSVLGTIELGELKVNVKKDSRVFGCGEIKQLFDSSVLISMDKKDYITSYLWDFGNKTFATTEKDPYHSFSSFGFYDVTHVVTSALGCKDSVKYKVSVNGPQPKFEISPDTMGCEPVTVTIKNLSKSCIQYYWRMGDPSNTTFLMDSTKDLTFTYSKPGKYYLNLTGIDTFYSTTTHTRYYCKSNYPADSTARSVTVLPYLKAGFITDTVICVGTELDLGNQSDPRYDSLRWVMSDGSVFWSPNQAHTPYTFKKAGKYTVSLFPEYTPPAGIHKKCIDTATQTITAKGILADFDYEMICESPLFRFRNLTTPDESGTKYFWEFGQEGALNNLSNLKHPDHDYGFNKGSFVACLRLQDEYGCEDSMCATINNDYKIKVIIPNVFTPGSIDSKNDEYDIEMVGEDHYALTIFNRWGQQVYKADKDCERGDGGNWNGNLGNKGIVCPPGTYFYILEYKNCYGSAEVKKVTGTITLIR